MLGDTDIISFSVPALYELYLNSSQPPVDEWTLSEAMAADATNGGLRQLEDHYKTFIVRLLVLHSELPSSKSPHRRKRISPKSRALV